MYKFTLIFLVSFPLFAFSSTNSFWTFLKGTTPANAIYLGMWSYHINYAHPFKDVNYKGDLIGLNYKSLYLGTFRNSFYNRSYFIGLRRNLWQKQDKAWLLQAGYGLGIVSGYKDGQSLVLSKYSPIIPAAFGYFDVTYHHFGIEIKTIIDVFSIGFKIDF